MPRPCKCRWIADNPTVRAFKPVGVPGRKLEVVELALDEWEALRLADVEGLYHDAAAEQMGISRPTFGRLVERARHKVASSLFGLQMLVLKGGPVAMRNLRTFGCADCGACFQAPHGTPRPAECPTCHSQNIHRIAEDRGPLVDAGGQNRRRGRGNGGNQGRCRRRRAGWSRVAGYVTIVEPTVKVGQTQEENS